MQIYCPQCHTGYQVDDDLLSNTSRKLKCSWCGAVFTIEDGIRTQEAVEDPFDSLKQAMTETLQEDISTDRVISSEPAEQVINEAAMEKSVSKPEDPEDSASADTDAKESSADETNESAGAGEQKSEGTDSEKQESEEVKAEETDEDLPDQPVDLEKIFERLSEHTEQLMESEQKLPFYEKAWLQIKNVLGFHFKIPWVYIFSFCALFIFINLYNNRYDVVRKAPFMNAVFKSLGVKAKIPGEGLEFHNIGWDFTDDDEGSKLEVKGFIDNSTDRDIDLPTIHIEILDKETSLLQSQNKEMEERKVEASSRIPLSFIIRSPAPTAKYVYMTFIDKD